MSLNLLLSEIHHNYYDYMDKDSDLLFEVGFREASKYFKRPILSELGDLRLFIPLKNQYSELDLKLYLRDPVDYCKLDCGIVVPEIVAKIADLNYAKYEFEKENNSLLYTRAFSTKLNLFS